MKVIHFDKKESSMKLCVEWLEDLWYLTKLISPGDFIESSSFRLFKPENLRQKEGEKKKVFLTLLVETVEFAEAVNKLRVFGKIVGGHPEEFVSIGSHHTIDLEPESVFTLKKEEFTLFHLKTIEEARKREKKVSVLIILMEEDKASLHRLEHSGAIHLCDIFNKGRKSDEKSYAGLRGQFFTEVLEKAVSENCDKIVVAGPGFTAEDFKKFARDRNEKVFARIMLEHVSTSEKSGVNELLKKGVFSRIMNEYKLEEELISLEELKKSIGKADGLACYGLQDVRKAVEYNAVSKILVLDELMRRDKEVSDIVEEAEEKGAELLIFNSDDDAGKEFKELKIAALLRFRIY